MAAGQHNPSRRALLGAAVGFPLLPGVAEAQGPLHHASHGPPPRTGEEWVRALATYRTAEAGVRGFERATAGSSFEEAARLEGHYGDLGDAMYSALRRLLRAPAPGVGALAVKIGLVVEHEVGTLEGGEACFAALQADALRLGSA